jgi:large-conductance mechanosensitive channel
MSIVDHRFMAAIEAIADPSVILPVLSGVVFGVAFTLIVSAIVDQMHHRRMDRMIAKSNTDNAKENAEMTARKNPEQAARWTP